MIAEQARIESALSYVPAVDRDLWLRMGMAVKSELGDEGFPVWDAWSQSAENYRERDARAVWKSINGSGMVTAGTLYHEAKQRGWKPNGAAPDQADAMRGAHAKHVAAAERAGHILAAATGETKTHPYWCKKTVSLGPLVKRGAWPQRGWTDALLVPIYQRDGKVWGIEAINENSDKDTLKDCKKGGGFYPFGKIRGASRVLIGEGVATVAAALTADGAPGLAALTAGNLKAVAQWARNVAAEGADIIILADFDPKPDGLNPGIKAAQEAAQAVGGRVAIPELDGRACDFWDVWAERGQDAMQHALANAQAPVNGEGSPSEWPEPLPLVVTLKPEPYPLDALPDTIRAAVIEVQGFTKAPIPMVASSALAALSLAIQAHVDVKRAEKLSGPTSLFLLTIADSGERKSTCDGIFTKAIRDYEAQQAEAAKPKLKDHRAAMQSWEAKRSGIKDKIRLLAKQGNATSVKEAELRDLGDAPEPPRVPKLIYGDATPEALKWNLAKLWPSGGVVSAEGGIVFGSHGMNKESIMRNLATLNELWDGKPISTERRTSESFTVRGARLTMGIQVQEATLRSFFDRSGGLARGTGFLARFLGAWPESTQGFRPFTDPPESWPALAAFNRRIAAILDQPVPIDDDGALSPPMVPLTPEAKAAWVEFHDEIEGMLRTGGELYDVRDVASKSADNAARLAALIQVFEHGTGGAVGLEAFAGASPIAAWHLNESRRFFGELALPVELANAARLDAWLIEYCKRERTHIVPRREVQRCGPNGLREKAALAEALRELAEAGRVRVVHEGRRKEILVNPALVIEGGAA